MTWPGVGAAYVRLAQRVLSEAVAPAPRVAPEPSLPELRLEHLIRMTDDTGLLQHAIRSVPDPPEGLPLPMERKCLEGLARMTPDSTDEYR